MCVCDKPVRGFCLFVCLSVCLSVCVICLIMCVRACVHIHAPCLSPLVVSFVCLCVSVLNRSTLCLSVRLCITEILSVCASVLHRRYSLSVQECLLVGWLID